MPDSATVETQPAPSSVTGTSTNEAPSSTGTDTQTTTSQPTTAEETFFDAKTIPEALKATYEQMQKAYTQKTQSVAEVKKHADAFKQLVNDREFVDWWNGRRSNSGNQGKPTTDKAPATEDAFPTPTPEEFEALQNDPVKFAKWQQKAFDDYVQKKYAPEIQKDRQEVAQIKAEHATNLFAQEHSDFWDLDALTQEKPEDPGLMEIMTAAGLDLSGAYSLGQRIKAKINSEATKLAHQTVTTKTNATTEDRSPASGNQQGQLKIKGDLSAAIRAAAMEAAEGRSSTVRRER